MKKLILVTLLAVAASWLLSEVGQPDEQMLAGGVEQSVGKLDGDGRDIVEVQLTPADPALQLEPPSPTDAPDSLPRTPRRKDDDARSNRAATSPAGPKFKAKAGPSWFPKSDVEEQAKARADGFGALVLVGRLSASEDRALRDLRRLVEGRVGDWLSADVPPSWKVPAGVVDAMVQGAYVQEVTRNLTATDPSAGAPATPEAAGLDGLYTLYRAGQKLDFSASRRAQVVGMYRQDLAARRLRGFGGGMALALIGLAILSGYIKADEATKGYYTNRLRLLAAAGLGASGVVAYRLLA